MLWSGARMQRLRYPRKQASRGKSRDRRIPFADLVSSHHHEEENVRRLSGKAKQVPGPVPPPYLAESKAQSKRRSVKIRSEGATYLRKLYSRLLDCRIRSGSNPGSVPSPPASPGQKLADCPMLFSNRGESVNKRSPLPSLAACGVE